MITTQTTLILGAGASAPFGFPTGYKLLQDVLAITLPSSLPNNFPYFDELGLLESEVIRFYNELRKSGKKSVDSFLEHRPEFISIGKAAIALVLIQCENENNLFKRDGQSWYEYLFEQLNTKFDDFNKNKLSILTFNYDRSLEHYLFTSLINSYGVRSEECVRKLRAIPIIHLHGDLGNLPHFESAAMRPYKNELNSNSMSVATQRIKIVHEGFDNVPQFRAAKEILWQSKVICFLGFGYHPLNLQRLGFDKTSYPQIRHFGSTYGFTIEECSSIDRMFGGKLAPLNNNGTGRDVLEFLRNTGVLQIDYL